MQFQIPKQVSYAINQIQQAGFECFIVGGAIRNALLNIPISDYDLTTNASTDQMLQIFQDQMIIPTGIQHGTITLHIDHMNIEITTYRKDGEYVDHRKPKQVEFVSSLLEDCKRRDFTINAMCYNPQVGLVDFFHGQQDLKQKTIRCIGDPHQRFEEDALRILRALRFAARLDFEIDPLTKQAMLDLCPLLHHISKERIYHECFAFLGYASAPRYIVEFFPIFQQFLPFNQSIEVLQPILEASLNDALVRFAILFQATSHPIQNAQDLKLTRQQIKTIQSWYDLAQYPLKTIDDLLEVLFHLQSIDPRYFAYRFANDQTINMDQIQADLQMIQQQKIPYTYRQLAIDGQDLLALGYHGKQIGILLNELLHQVMHHHLPNQKKDLYLYLQHRE